MGPATATANNARSLTWRAVALAALLFAPLSACVPDRIKPPEGEVFAPGVDPRQDAVSGIEVGHRLIAAEQYELAIDAFTRAALDDGLNGEILLGLGTANLGLGRLGQAEDMLRQAVEMDPEWPAAWNNLGVVLMETGQTTEAEGIFRKAYALDNGESDSIRDNLRLALAKRENPGTIQPQDDVYKLVQRGRGDFLLQENQD